MDNPIQGAAVVELGTGPGSTTDYSCYFSEFVPQKIRNTVRKPSSPGSPDVEDKAGGRQHVVVASFLASPLDASSPWGLLNAAADTAAAEVYFRVRYASGPVSASNPLWTGWIVVSQLGIGSAVRQTPRQVITFPARGVAGPITSE